MKIAIAATGYVSLSNVIFLARPPEATTLDTQPEKVASLNDRQSSLADANIRSFPKDQIFRFCTFLNKIEASRHADFAERHFYSHS